MKEGKLTLAQKEGIIAWAAISSSLHDADIVGIEGDLAKIPGAKRDLALVRKIMDKYMPLLIREMNFDKDSANWFLAIWPKIKVYTSIVGRKGHEPISTQKDTGWYLTYQDINCLVSHVGTYCVLCNKTRAEANGCQLKRVFDHLQLPDYGDGSDWCDYHLGFAEAVCEEDEPKKEPVQKKGKRK